jgi:hypothetical protein
MDRCAFPETLLLEADGVSDPRQLTERFLLGRQGSMAA